MPLVYALSHLVFFTLVVGRAQHRFTLPIWVALSVYVGHAAASLSLARGGTFRRGVELALVALFAWNGLRAAGLAYAGFADARRRVEALLALKATGKRVETYGLTVHQPRFKEGFCGKGTAFDQKFRHAAFGKDVEEVFERWCFEDLDAGVGEKLASVFGATPLCPAGHLPLKGGDRWGAALPDLEG